MTFIRQNNDNIVLEVETSDGQFFHHFVDRSVLSSSCDYFEAFFHHSHEVDPIDNLPTYHLLVEVPDERAVKCLLAYLQGQELDLDVDNFPSVMKQADGWCLDEHLTPQLVKFLESLLQPITSKQCSAVTATVEKSLAMVNQVFRLLNAAESYGLEIWSKEEFVVIRRKCVKWLGKNFDKVLVTKGFHSLPKKLQDESLEATKQMVSIANCIMIYTRCNTVARKIGTSGKKKGEYFVSKLRKFCFDFIIDNLEEVLMSDMFDQLLTNQWNDGELDEFFNEIVDHLDADNAPTIFLSICGMIASLEQIMKSRRRLEPGEVVKAKIKKLPRLKHRIQEYCQKHALSVLRGSTYRKYSQATKDRFSQELKLKPMDEDQKTSPKKGWSFVVLDEDSVSTKQKKIIRR